MAPKPAPNGTSLLVLVFEALGTMACRSPLLSCRSQGQRESRYSGTMVRAHTRNLSVLLTLDLYRELSAFIGPIRLLDREQHPSHCA